MVKEGHSEEGKREEEKEDSHVKSWGTRAWGQVPARAGAPGSPGAVGGRGQGLQSHRGLELSCLEFLSRESPGWTNRPGSAPAWLPLRPCEIKEGFHEEGLRARD